MIDLCCSIPLIELPTMMNACKDESMPTDAAKPIKGVRWADEERSEIPIRSPLECLTSEQEWQSMWYHASDLEAFRSEVRAICYNIRLQSRETLYNLARNSYFRGMEQRTSMERQRRKFLAIKCIVRGQAKLGGNAIGLAALAQKCTAWASILAIEEASRDFIRAYADEHPSECLKRVAEDSDAERRVRPRVAVHFQ
jgi:hypothetical protein